MVASIVAQAYSFSLNDDGSLHVHVNVGFVVSGVGTNFSVALDVPQPTLLTAALFNFNIQTKIADYTNTNYSTSFTAADVVLLGGVVAV